MEPNLVFDFVVMIRRQGHLFTLILLLTAHTSTGKIGASLACNKSHNFTQDILDSVRGDEQNNYSPYMPNRTFGFDLTIRERTLTVETMDLNQRPLEAEGRIINGAPVSELDRYPYIASILNSRSYPQGMVRVWHVCGGSLIAPDIVLGAAHCSGSSSDYVQLGKVHVTGASGSTGGESKVETFRILDQRVHPEWNRRFFYRDMVLYKLDKKTDKTPIRLDQTSFGKRKDINFGGFDGEDSISKSTDFTILGWGKTELDGGPSLYLREAHVHYIPHDECSSSTYAYGSVIKDDAMMCFAGEGTDACQGDSGGPLVRKHRESEFQNDPLYDTQVGVISWGIDCAHKKYPGVYARIDFRWIQDAICNPSDGMSPESCTGGRLYPPGDDDFDDFGVGSDDESARLCEDKDSSEFFNESWDKYSWNCDKVAHWWWYACLYYSSECPETCCPGRCNLKTGLCETRGR